MGHIRTLLLLVLAWAVIVHGTRPGRVSAERKTDFRPAPPRVQRPAPEPSPPSVALTHPLLARGGAVTAHHASARPRRSQHRGAPHAPATHTAGEKPGADDPADALAMQRAQASVLAAADK